MLSTTILLLCLSVPAPEAEVLSRAVQLREDGKDEAALALLSEAHAARPTPRLAAQLGLVEAARERWISAEAHLSEALAATSDAWVKSQRGLLEQRLTAVQGRLGWLVVKVQPDGVAVALAGERVGVAPLGGPVRVVAGPQAVRLTRQGYKAVERSVDVAAGRTGLVEVTLAPEALVSLDLAAPATRSPVSEPPPPSAAPPGRGALFWLTAAGAVVSLAAGVVGVVAATQSDDATPGAVVGVAGLSVGAALSGVVLYQLFGTDELPEAPAIP